MGKSVVRTTIDAPMVQSLAYNRTFSAGHASPTKQTRPVPLLSHSHLVLVVCELFDNARLFTAQRTLHRRVGTLKDAGGRGLERDNALPTRLPSETEHPIRTQYRPLEKDGNSFCIDTALLFRRDN
ncbi:unnamed protein product, partial [Brenthis ino]